MSQEIEESNQDSSNYSKYIFQTASSLANALSNIVWTRSKELNRINPSDHSERLWGSLGSSNHRNPNIKSLSCRNRFLQGNRHYCLIKSKGIQTEDVPHTLLDPPLPPVLGCCSKAQPDTTPDCTNVDQRVNKLENELSDIKKELESYGIVYHEPDSSAGGPLFPGLRKNSQGWSRAVQSQYDALHRIQSGQTKVTKSRPPLGHHLPGARRVLPESGFVRQLNGVQAHKPDQRHKNTMRNIVEEIPKVKLRRTEMILDTGGELKRNRFWDEIYNSKRSWRSSTLQRRY
ncbi:hypothetical protein CLU79DRAFT_749329 [Phycomyces nitens]|nr:hypothetical protein CLU79DRAFT_749329 [Phycomyces nitens]